MKKFGYMFIGALFTLILSIGFLSFADSETDFNNETLEEVTDLQTDFILEESKLGEELIHVVEESPVLAVHVNTSEPIKKKEDSLVNEELIVAGNPFLEKLEKLEITIESDQTEIKLKQERKKKKVKSEVEIEWKNEKVKLKDQRAEEFIEEMFSAVDIEETQDLPLLAEQWLEEFQMNPHAVEIDIQIEKLDGTTYKFEVDN
ncbi:Phr family secreted Rap phosphatase inhibitor [Halalkalibacter alkalisediminis]|uniref:Phr family secreted Rap phosphatase inhibitor n=1 Tax=Halalkalibacter alkalisediminis TaxID=935616 RepID=A0ABV6NI20_9BACI|nr:Phr family secreted Rap phosphatase inhibitor [Halalkalibacter alkalisediminis]